jgi:hypothetical protein
MKHYTDTDLRQLIGLAQKAGSRPSGRVWDEVTLNRFIRTGTFPVQQRETENAKP